MRIRDLLSPGVDVTAVTPVTFCLFSIGEGIAEWRIQDTLSRLDRREDSFFEICPSIFEFVRVRASD